MAENYYQAKLIRKLHRLYPDCMIMKNDTNYLQGIPDITILFEDKWAVLEIKDYENAPVQPNQEWYVAQLNMMSFSAFIYPENEEEVLDALQQTFRPRRSTRVSKSKRLPLD